MKRVSTDSEYLFPCLTYTLRKNFFEKCFDFLKTAPTFASTKNETQFHCVMAAQLILVQLVLVRIQVELLLQAKSPDKIGAFSFTPA